MLHSSAEGFPNSPVIDEGVREAVARSGIRMAYFVEYLESYRFPEELASLALRDYVRAKYSGVRIDAVLADSNTSLQFALRHRDTLFPQAPIVFAAATQPGVDLQRRVAGVTGIIRDPSVRDTLALALRLQPSTRRAFVIAESPGSPLQEMIRAAVDKSTPNVEIAFITEQSVPRMIAAVEAVPPQSIVLFVQYSQEGPGIGLRPSDLARMVAQASPVPVYGIADDMIGSGVVGGMMYATRSLGIRLGEITARILGGARVDDIPVGRATHVPMFDWRQLRRWDIADALVPAGSVFLFRPQSFFEQYGHYALGGLLVFIAQLALIGGLLLQRARRRRAEEETRTSEARYRSVVDKQSDLICRFLPDSTLTFVNDAYCRFWNKTREELLGHKFIELIPPSAREMVLDRVGRLSSGIDSNEHPVLLADGTIGWQHWINQPILDEQGRLIEIQGVGRDITDRKRAEEAIVQLEARNSAILRAIPDLMFLLNKDGEYLDYYASDKTRLLLDPAQFLGRRMQDVLPPALAAMFKDAFARLATGETPIILDYGLEMADGDRHYEARMVSCSGDQVLTVVRDMTERRRAEHTLHETQAELARVSRLTALGEFAASIAHEVRQPLTTITINAKTCLRWLNGVSPDLAEVRAALMDIVEAGQRADDVIGRNRELFNDHTVQKVPIDLNEVIGEVAVLARQRLQANRINLTTRVDGPLPLVNADRIQLQQVMLNLISNSIDAMEGSKANAREVGILASMAPDGMVKVAVSDTGVGLEGVDVRRMFMLSYTTKPRGTGVGLSISRAIVEAHAGELWAEQNDGGGATFFFTLPTRSTAATTAQSRTSVRN